MNLIGSLLSYCVILSLYSCSLTSALKLTDVLIPKNGVDGDSVVLRCEFSLGKYERLLYQRWYKDGQEIYRFGYYTHPSDYIKTFPQDGVHIDEEASDVYEITLRKVTKKTSGTYQCLVSMDWPHYQVMTQSGYLHVTGEGEITFSSHRSLLPAGFSRASSRSGGGVALIFYTFLNYFILQKMISS